MAKNITDIDDYKGYVQIVDDTEQETYFNQIVFEIEREILRGNGINDYGFLGDAEYINLIADLDSNNEPQTQKFIDLVDGKNYTNSSGRTVIFLGIKEMLKLMVYSVFLERDSQNSDGSGIIELKVENAEKVEQKRMRREAHIRWNRGVEMFNGEAYQYMIDNQADFSDWLHTKQSKYLNGII